MNEGGSPGRGRFWSYPHPFMDLSSYYVPRSAKEMFKMAQHLFCSHSEINSTIKNKCSYAQTELIYETEEKDEREIWQNLLESMDYEKFEYMLLLDLEVYGNAFSTIIFPTNRYATCPSCSETFLLKKATWRFNGGKFHVNCINKKCTYAGHMPKIEDRAVKNRKKARFLRWNPNEMSVLKNPFTGAKTFLYTPPKWMYDIVNKSEKDANKIFVEGTPLPLLQAIFQKKSFKFSPDMVNHISEPSVSMGDDGLGMPPLMSVYKDVWLYQVYRRAQEANGMENVLPMRILSPGGNQAGQMANQSMDLSMLMSRIHGMVRGHRRDQNAMFASPYPITLTEVGGDASRFSVSGELQFMRNNIIQGLQVPHTIASGEASWSGSSVSLRILENLYIVKIKGLDKFLRQFVVPKLKAAFDLPNITIRHRPFKMADDPQRQQIYVSLRGNNVISDQTMLEEMGIDSAKERERKIKESKERREQMAEQIMVQAKANGEATVLQAKFTTLAEMEQQKTQQNEIKAETMKDYEGIIDGDPGASDNATSLLRSVPVQEEPPTKGTGVKSIRHSPALLDTFADDFMASTSPETYPTMLQNLENTNPDLASLVKEKKSAADKKGSIYTLPEQRPPRSNKAGI